MKMDRMVALLEERGFKTEKRYDKRDQVYLFTITKNGLSVMDSFKYPSSANYAVVDNAQNKFIDHITDYWKRTFTPAHGPKPSNEVDWRINNIEWNFDSNGAYYDANISAYIINDINTTHATFHDYLMAKLNGPSYPEIKNVIFNDPATIVFWHDGTKTVVKCSEDDIFDPEKGLAMAISKKFLGNQGNYYNEIRKWVGADLYMNEKTHNDLENLFDNITVDALAENMRNLLNRLEGRK